MESHSIIFPLSVLTLGLFVCKFTEGAEQDYFIPFTTRSDCLTGDDDLFHQFYDFSQLKCTACTQNNTQQTIAEDGLSCICQDTQRRYDYQNSDGKLIWQCAACAANKVSSADRYSCVSCTTGTVPNCQLCTADLDLTAERYMDGERLTDAQNESVRTCITCVDDTSPVNTGENRCSRCNQVLSVQPSLGCTCLPESQAGGLCYRDPNDLKDDSPSLYTINYGENSEFSVVSEFLFNNVRPSHAACVNRSISDSSRADAIITVKPVYRAIHGKNKMWSLEAGGLYIEPNSEYSNLTACQLLGNTCVMTLYSQRYGPPNELNDACSLHTRLVNTYGDSGFPRHIEGYRAIYEGISEWRSSMPWLFYEPESAPQILDDPSIPMVFNPGMTLTLVAAKYTLEGHFKGLVDLSAQDLHVCLDKNERLDKAFDFGVGYKKECDVFIGNLLENPHYDLYFYDLFLQYVVNNEVKLHAVPVLITNYRDKQELLVNQESDRTLWQLMRRFYLVDRVTGVSTGGGFPQFIRYAESMKLHIRLQEGRDGLIFPPYLEITYNEVIYNDEKKPDYVKATFTVDYSMDVSKFDTGIAVATGVLCGLAVLYAAMRTFTWNKREGKVVLDFFFLVMFLVYCCGALANAFFMVTLGFSITWLALYKGQTVFYMVPDDAGVYYVQAFLGTAFTLKFIQLMYIIIKQVTIDIFLVDWERPRRKENEDLALEALRGQDITDAIAMALKKDKNSQVSVWRTYFVANEWNEIQTVRRVNPVVHMLLVLMILYGIGVQELARYETQSTVTTDTDSYHGEYNLVFRFTVLAAVFILVALAQRLFYWLIWSRFKQHPINNFIDLCSLTNISVFVMSQNNYGYYIHGRSPHGHADVGLKKTRENIYKEEEDLCGTRGLVPGEDQQTFEFAIPNKFRSEYNKVLLSYTMRGAANIQQTPRAATRITVDMEKKIQSYHVLNRFIQNFMDHNIKDLNYVIANKNLAEKVLDTELKDSTYVGYFYYAEGGGFHDALLYGHETTLQMLELLFFTVVDMIFYDYVLAGVLTYLVDLLIVTIRKNLGKRNLAKKTMVDDRFLI